MWHSSPASDDAEPVVELVARFVDAATEAGVSRVATLTRHGAEGSGDFYHRLGWSPVPSAEQGEWDRYELTL